MKQNEGKKILRVALCIALMLVCVVATLTLPSLRSSAHACQTDGCDGVYTDGICTVCGGYEEPTLKNGYYEIGNLGQLKWFAEKVNGGETSVSAKLMNDIDATSVSYIGIGKDADHAFAGTFDGNNKTLKIALVSTEQYVAPFLYVSGATIRNLTVSGTIKTTHKFAAGIVGRVESGSATLENCLSLVQIDSTNYSGDGTHGGLIGVVGGNGTTTINNCGFAGSMIGSNTTSCGGIVGWTDNNSRTNISNSYVSAYFNLSGNNGNTFGRNPSYVSLTNCYYLNALSDASTATQMSAESFASGEVAYKLGSAWKQTIGTDAYPNFTSTQSVYSYTNCAGTASYSNDSTIEAGSHDYSDNGICKVDSTHYQPCETDASGVYLIKNAGNLFWFAAKVNGGETSINAKLTANIDLENRAWTAIGTESNPYAGTFDGGDFTISNFSMTVTEGNNQGLFGAVSGGTVKNFTLKGKLDITATIDISDVSNIKSISNVGGVVGYATSKAVIENVTSCVTITDSHTPFTYTDASGTVQSIRVSGIGGIVGYMDGSTVSYCTYDGTITSVCGASIAGIVGNASNSATVDHCTNKGNVTAENNSAHIGGIAGDTQTGTTISYCLNYGNITSSGGDCIGGIAAYANQNVKIVSCGNIGKVTCTADDDGFIGGILGYINNRNFKGISDCFNYGAIVTADGKTAHAGAILGYNRNSGSVYSNNYYLDSSCTKSASDNAISDVYAMTATQFTSGEIAYKLGGAWKQTIGTDSYPNFTGKAVYYGYRSCADEQKVYTNSTVSDTVIAHTFGEDGFCTAVAGETHYLPAVLKDGYYEISNAGQLYWFAAQVNSGNTSINGKLTADIAVNPGTFDENGNYTAKNGETARQWTPIGGSSNNYKGTFDGNNKSISGIYINGTSSYTGLFGYIGKNGTVKNVAVKNSYIKGRSTVGGVAGHSMGTITNCYNSATVSGTGNYVGGVAGSNSGTITNCYNTGTVKGSDTGSKYVGGVTGSNSDEVTNCYNTGTVTGSRYVGGVVGMNEGNSLVGYGEITNCYNTGTVSGSYEVGGVIGRNNGDDPTNCYYLTGCATDSKGTAQYGIGNGTSGSTTADVADQTTGATADQFTSGEVTYLLNGKSSAESVVWKQTLDGKSYPGFTGKIVYCGYASCTATTQSYINEPYTTPGHHYDNGFCTRCGGYEEPTLVDGYYEIDNAGKLYWFAAQVNSGSTSINGKLTDNITVNSGKFDADGNYTVDGVSATPMDWTPIGDSVNKYDGTFDGNGKYISGLYVNSTDNRNGIGLFGCVGQNGAVKAVAVKNFYIKGASNVGGVAGANSGLITNCTSSGIVTGDDWYVGGVAGINSATGEITNCSNSGTVSGSGSVGGVAGYNGKTITNCFNSGTVTGSEYIGGVVGYSFEATITSCYNSGTVNGSTDVGGVVGYSDGTITNCYYLDTGASVGIGSGDGEAVAKTQDQFTSGEVTYLLNGKSSAENVVWKQTLDGKSSPGFTGEIVYYGYLSCAEGVSIGYTNNSKATLTKPDHDYDNGICTVCGQYEPCAGKGTATEPYLIANAGNLFWFAAKANSGETSINAKLTADIDLKSREWTPIGNMENPYIGTFDGTKYDANENAIGNYAISGLYVNGDHRIGLFGLVGQGGTVKNVTVKDAYIEGDQYVGGVVGQNHGGTLTNCTVSGTVIGSENVGGVVGNNWGVLTGCTNTATVTGTGDNVGGVVGSNYSGTLTNCTSSGTVSGSESVGGVVGYNNWGVLTGCTNTATVSGTGDNVGGVVGYNNTGDLTSCTNTGTVSGTGDNVGGVVGYNNSGTITGNYNTGTVTGTGDYVGGLVGYNELGDITNCYNTGTVIGSNYVGGVAGALPRGTIAFCYNIGTVIGINYVGGIAGKIENGGCVSCCYLTGTANKAVGEGDGADAYELTADEFKSGAATWLLNGEFADEEVVWKQTLGMDDYPGYSGGTVYSGYAQQCNETKSYTNDKGTASEWLTSPHVYNDNGFCTKTEGETHYEACEGEGTAEKPYLIKNAGNLYWFAAQVNGGNTTINGKLTADITVNSGTFAKDGTYTPGDGEAAGTTPRVWTPIGNSTYPYTGTFDGAKSATENYTISGLYNNGDDSYFGLFGSVGSGATVKNIGVVNCYFSGWHSVGGVAADNIGKITNCTVSGTVSTVSGSAGGVVANNAGEVTGCSNSGTVTGGGDVGGVVGYNSGVVTNCYNTGTVARGDYSIVGGVVGYNDGKVTNCYNTGTVTGGTAGGVVGEGSGLGTVTNCYYLDTCAGSGIGSGDGEATAMTAAQFTSGEVTWLLNGKSSEGTTESPLVWKQTLNGTSYPGFTGDIVYCNYINCKDTEYSNTQTSAVPLHDYTNNNGFCKGCGAYEPCEQDESSVYLIKNAGNLYWFAEQVNGGQTSINGKLMADITVNENVLKKDGTLNGNGSNFRAWTPIGNEGTPYCGTFDGNDKTISGLYYNGSDEYVGLFGYLQSGATIKNVTVADTYFKSSVTGEYIASYVGGIAGYVFALDGDIRISGCTSSGTFTAISTGGDASNAYVGGIVGHAHAADDIKISGCTSSASVKAVAFNGSASAAPYTFAYAGGIVGCAEAYNGTLNIEGCHNTGDATAEANGGASSSRTTAEAYAGGIVGYACSRTALKIERCYSTGNATSEAHGDYSAASESFAYAYSGGLVGYAIADIDATLNIESCYNTGDATATADNGNDSHACSGGLMGYADAYRTALKIERCYNTGDATATADGDGYSCAYSGGLVGRAYNGTDDGCVTIRNCYYLNTSAADAIGNQIGAMTTEAVEAKTEAQFTSGEVTWLLNGKRSEGTTESPLVWKQTLNGTSYPGFTGEIVYYGYISCKDIQYSNTQTSATPLAHDYTNNNGFCKGCGAYEPCEQDESGVYLIKNAGNLYWFAEQVNGGQTSINGKLMADITVNENVLKKDGTLNGNGSNFRAWTPIGNGSNPYTGTFDGNGKTISGLYYNGSDKYVGLFGYIQGGATIKNVTVTDTYFEASITGENAHAYVGGIAGCVDAGNENGVQITDCTVSGTFIATADDLSSWDPNATAYVGGIAGYVDAGTDNTVTISGCTSSGNVTAEANGGYVTAYAGGLVGCARVTSNSKLNIENSHNTGTVTATTHGASIAYPVASTYAGGIVGYVNALNSTVNISGCTSSGDVTAETYGGDSISATASYAYSGGIVGYANAASNAIVNISACTSSGNVTAEDHGGYSADDTSSSEAFSGGLVGYALADMDGTLNIKRCYNTGVVTATADDGNSTYAYSGGLVGSIDASGAARNLNIESCYSTGKVTVTADRGASYAYSGGLVGCAFDATDDGCVTIRNCYYLNTSAADAIGDQIGAMTTEAVEAKTEDQFTSGEVTWLLNGKTSEGELVWKQTLNGTSYPGFTGDTVYKLTNTGCSVVPDKYSNDASEVYAPAHGTSGYTYLPLGGTHKKQCKACGQAVGEEENCTFGADGFCTVCGGYEPCEGEGTADKPYLIKNAGNLYWFAEQVNGGNTSINGRLMNDITVNPGTFAADGTYTALNGETPRQWTRIGTDRRAYTGTFDGQNHTISGLYYNGSDNFVGLFAYLNAGATIQNVGVTNSYFQTSNSVPSLGGIVGNAQVANERTIMISNCSSAAHLVATGDNMVCVGGVVGGVVSNYAASVTIQNCSNTGKITATSASGYSYCGGVVGYVGAEKGNVTIQKCANTGELSATSASGYSYCGGVAGSVNLNYGSVTVQNCFSTGDITATSTASSYAPSYCGGVVGNVSSDFGSATIQNCFSTGKLLATSASGYSYCGGVAGYAYACGSPAGSRGTVNISNCYYTANDSCGATDPDGSGATITIDKVDKKTAAQFVSGEVTWLLNGQTSEGELVWKQTLDGTNYPGFTGDIVYKQTSGTGSESYTNTPPESDIISVTITWTTMEFTYTDGAWNSDTHSYGDGTWSTSGGTVTVENNGNVTVTASFVYATTRSDIGGSFTKQNFELSENARDTTALTLSGKPSAPLSKTQLGSITVTIAPKSE